MPEAVIRSLPFCRASIGLSLSRSTAVGSSGSTMSPPCQLRWMTAFTFAPSASGEVSTCAMKPTTGTFAFFVVAGTVAKT